MRRAPRTVSLPMKKVFSAQNRIGSSIMVPEVFGGRRELTHLSLACQDPLHFER